MLTYMYIFTYILWMWHETNLRFFHYWINSELLVVGNATSAISPVRHMPSPQPANLDVSSLLQRTFGWHMSKILSRFRVLIIWFFIGNLQITNLFSKIESFPILLPNLFCNACIFVVIFSSWNVQLLPSWLGNKAAGSYWGMANRAFWYSIDSGNFLVNRCLVTFQIIFQLFAFHCQL
jgi:hypothetical protein